MARVGNASNSVVGASNMGGSSRVATEIRHTKKDLWLRPCKKSESLSSYFPICIGFPKRPTIKREPNLKKSFFSPRKG
ncbi:hypothetical protein Peur_034217 [Populus x canadensis]